MALVASNRYRSFQFSKSGPKNDTVKAQHKCKDSPAYDFAIAQPAMLNRYTLGFAVKSAERYSRRHDRSAKHLD
jgi:hypothetical protein